MVGVPLGTVTVFGSNFTADGQVYIDGTPASFSSFVNSSEIQTQIPLSVDEVPGTHIFTVRQASGTSSGETFIVYAPMPGPQPFNAASGYFPGGGVSGNLAMCDVNGDGYADAVMTGPTLKAVPSLAVMLGQAGGQLSPPSFTSGLSVGPIACGDVDSDGNSDIVTVTMNSNSSPIISVPLNDGKGKFRQGPVTAFMGIFPSSLRLQDMDSDGNLDLIIISEGALYYSRNEGGGSFAAPVNIAAPASDNPDLAVADFNEDGKPDIAYAAANSVSGQDQIHLLVNQGGGTFLDELAPGVTGEAGYFAAGDFNLDGHIDIAVEPQAPFTSFPLISIQVFLGQGNGSFLAGPTSEIESNAFQTFQLVAGDFDHDGNPDLAAENGDAEPGHVVIL
jgi:hypothetical protein